MIPPEVPAAPPPQGGDTGGPAKPAPRCLPGCRPRGLWLLTLDMSARVALLALSAGLFVTSAKAAGDTSAEFTLLWNERRVNTEGPLAAADALSPGIAPPAPGGLRAMAELRHVIRAPAGASLQGNVLLAHERLEGRTSHDDSRVNELHAALDLGSWQLSAGKRVLGWDVGYAFRPNDIVQQEERRTLFAQTPEGRPIVMLEHFSNDTAWSLVWAQPQRWNDPIEATRGARESALAARGYWRDGALDLHLFGRHGRHTGASVGAAAAWVATDELELHGSLRALERRDGWAFDAASPLVAASPPWRQTTLGRTGQALIGAQWTGAQRVSLLAELWYDGTALADAAWRQWSDRNVALIAAAAQGAPALPVAGNLAWQAEALDTPTLQRRNVFLRSAWQDGPWQVSLDALLMPADSGRVVTAAVQWQGDRVRLNASWRRYGGPAGALAAQLPWRHSAVVAATIAF